MAGTESQIEEGAVTDEDVLRDPDSYTVEQVVDVFVRSSDEQIAEAKALEAGGQDRKGISNWERPVPQQEEAEPTFSRERILGPEGPRIAGAPTYVIVGALHGDDAEEFTRAQVQEKVKTFLERPVQQEA